MTPDQLAHCLSAVGWNAPALARALGLEETTARRWLKGARPVPEAVAAWLEALAAAHRALPPPRPGGPTGRRGRPHGGALFPAPTGGPGEP